MSEKYGSSWEEPSYEAAGETPEGLISVEQLLSKIKEVKADEAAIFDIIFDAANSLPIPDPNDLEASQEYARRQTVINDYAKRRIGRVEFIKELEAWLAEKQPGSIETD
jgi:hypothetical protein